MLVLSTIFPPRSPRSTNASAACVASRLRSTATSASAASNFRRNTTPQRSSASSNFPPSGSSLAAADSLSSAESAPMS